MPGCCTICGRVYCDHTSSERELTPEQWEEELTRDLTPEEQEAFNSGDTTKKIQAGRKAASSIYGGIYSLPPDGDIVGF